MLHSRVTWLSYINRLEILYKIYWLKFRFWVIWFHRGQKFIFTKNASPHAIYIVWSRDLWIETNLRPFTKLIDSNFNLGSFGVTGVKEVIFTKYATPPTYYVVWSCDLCTWYTWRPATKVTILNFCLKVIWGHRGQKFISTKSDITRPCYIARLQDSYMCISLTPSTYVVVQGSTSCHSES